ncbi:DUF4115 domain-containing protein [Shewanella sp. 202IG2-18]|uniref:RodZ domain-containing protein n=1 Tax=Parashewanella hymeniacidonis TaxID=2807618 RepID=UPI0019616886|nr:RodZ domain-containing protein [Parashewanella hymeniacidonis]MBM7073723.1 DUF4115 domain-containing protein [Parashewanella hymeniacidonis]
MTDLNNDSPEQEAPKIESKPEHTIGSLLQKARNEKGLKKEDVAKALNLRITLIEEIEADDFSNTASTTYAKGYIKNYARLVAADPFLIQECIDAQLGLEKSPTMQSFSRKTTREAADNRLTWITYIIVIVLIGMFGFWWAQKSSFFSELTDLSKPTLEEQRLTETTPHTSVDTANVKTDAEQEANHSEFATDVALSPKQPQELEPQTTSANTDKSTPEQQSSPTQKIDDAPAAALTQPTTNSVENSNTETKVTAALTEINLQLTESCWIKLEDATGKVLILGEKKAGYNKIVSGKAPFNAVFGAPQAVQLTLNNQKVDLSYLPKSRVARLTLPLGQ